MCNRIPVVVYVIGYRSWCICYKIQVMNKIQVMVYM